MKKSMVTGSSRENIKLFVRFLQNSFKSQKRFDSERFMKSENLKRDALHRIVQYTFIMKLH